MGFGLYALGAPYELESGLFIFQIVINFFVFAKNSLQGITRSILRKHFFPKSVTSIFIC
jgi:hypothetical protein